MSLYCTFTQLILTESHRPRNDLHWFLVWRESPVRTSLLFEIRAMRCETLYSYLSASHHSTAFYSAVRRVLLTSGSVNLVQISKEKLVHIQSYFKRFRAGALIPRTGQMIAFAYLYIIICVEITVGVLVFVIFPLTSTIWLSEWLEAIWTRSTRGSSTDKWSEPYRGSSFTPESRPCRLRREEWCVSSGCFLKHNVTDNNRIKYNTIKCNAIQYNTTKYNTIQCAVELCKIKQLKAVEVSVKIQRLLTAGNNERALLKWKSKLNKRAAKQSAEENRYY